MKRTVIVVSIAGLAFAVVSLWTLRTEPVGPLLALPHPVPPNPESSTADTAALQPKKVEFIPPQLSEAADSEDSFPASAAPVTKERRAQVRALLRRLKPSQPDESINIWVEEFAGLSDDEIRFMVSQSASAIDSGDEAPFEDSGSSSFFISDPDTHPDVPEPVDVSTGQPSPAPFPQETTGDFYSSSRDEYPQLTTAWNNLQNCSTVGYRELLDLRIISASRLADTSRISTRSFASGDLQQTGNPLHLALQSSQPEFFQLEDGRLTRNGMFVRMPDGKLGLTAGEGYVALHDSPVLPATETFDIEPSGRVTSGRGRIVVGTIAVVLVRDVEQLSTDDGVYFRTVMPAVPATNVRLISGALELGNVDVQRNRDLLQAARLFE